MSMGVDSSSYLKSSKHNEACQKVLDVATAHGLVAGVHCASAEEVVQRYKQGFKFCPAVSDVNAVRAGAVAALQTVKSAKS
jgi:2-keto-3-deoxy-L-rhamnonate aldolase RhmA